MQLVMRERGPYQLTNNLKSITVIQQSFMYACDRYMSDEMDRIMAESDPKSARAKDSNTYERQGVQYTKSPVDRNSTSMSSTASLSGTPTLQEVALFTSVLGLPLERVSAEIDPKDKVEYELIKPKRSLGELINNQNIIYE